MKFTKLFISILCFLLSFVASAQKIKIKKDIIYIDKVEIPIKLESEYKNVDDGILGDFHQVLTFTDKSSSSVFAVVDCKGLMLSENGVKESWLEISNGSKEKTNLVDIDLSLGKSKKGVVKHLMNKYKFFDTKGIVNQDNIIAFFNSKTESKSAIKANASRKNTNASNAIATERLNSIRPAVKYDLKTIVSGGNTGRNVIGRVDAPDKYHETQQTPIKIYDLDDNLIASAKTDVLAPVTVTFIDGSVYEYKSRKSLSGGSGNERFLTELVENIVGQGFELGHNYNAISLENEAKSDDAFRERRAEQEKEFQRRFKKSKHIFEEKGFVITSEGKKIEGPITILFEKFQNPNNTVSSSINGITSTNASGKVLTIKVKDTKSGKIKNKRIRAKEGVSFAVFNDNGKETLYKALNLKNSFNLGWSFYEYIETHEGVEIFKSNKKNFIIKKSDLKHAYYVDYVFSLNTDTLSFSEKIKMVRFYNYLCKIEALPEDEEKMDIDGLKLSNIVDIVLGQFSEDDIVSVKKVISATKDCVIKK